jgi:hypothetical protein
VGENEAQLAGWGDSDNEINRPTKSFHIFYQKSDPIKTFYGRNLRVRVIS